MSRYDVQYPNQDQRRGGFYLAADPRTRKIKDLGQHVATTNAPVLIVGESGVGKEVLARYIHAESERARRPFVKINCAAVPHDLLESELFGHERGAFTGAHQRKEGKFELAPGGTILLDEIGEMDLPLQAKLLHVLEDSTFTRVGGTQPIRIDARIMATTNKPLEEAIANGEFRADLYFRLKVIQIRIPPLRERQADIPLLCEHFLRTESARQGSSVTRIPDRLVDAFFRYPWPGNVRELKHLIERYLILPDEEMVLSELMMTDSSYGPGPYPPAASTDSVGAPVVAFLDGHYGGPGPGDSVRARNGKGRGKIPLKSIAAKAAEEAEKKVILQVLQEARWNRKRAASRLDICYKTLLHKLDQWELEPGAGGFSARS
jgi:two-component system response regulator AtoC